MKTPRSRSITRAFRATVAICALLFAIAVRPAFGGVNAWTSNGPNGAVVSSIAVDPITPSTLYLGTTTNGFGPEGHGIFKSIDGGESWGAVNNGLTTSFSLDIQAIVLDPKTPGTLYAASDAIYKSIDGGAHWDPASIGISDEVIALVIDPETSATVYAVTSHSGIFRSADGGDFWTQIGGVGVIGTSLGALAIDPSAPATLYASGSGGIYKTVDGGANWSHLNNESGAIVIAPDDPATIYVSGSSLIKSSDGGAHWGDANTGLPELGLGTLAADPRQPGTLYAGFASDSVFGSVGGVFKTIDGGAHWNPASAGLVTINARTLALDPNTADTVYAGTDGGGIFKSSDGGDHWRVLNEGLPHLTVKAVTADPATTGLLYAATKQGGVFTSSDGGGHWEPVNAGLLRPKDFLLSLDADAIAIDPGTPAILYTALDTVGAFKSGDSGATWNAAMTGLTGAPSAFAIDPAGALYAVANLQLFKSPDGGGTWGVIPAIGVITSVALDPATARTLYAGGEYAIYKSTNAGASWSSAQIDRGAGQVVALGADGEMPGTVYAGTEFRGVFVSEDRGATWNASNGGLASDGGRLAGRAVQVDLAAPGTAYFGTDDGVFKTTDGGRNWRAVGDNALKHIASLAMDAEDHNKLYAGTDDGGVFVIEQTESTPTATPTPTPTLGNTATPSAPPETATPTTGSSTCVGDCGGTSSVNISALITLVNIALGTTDPSACPHGIPPGMEVNISMLIQAVNNALNGCAA